MRRQALELVNRALRGTRVRVVVEPRPGEEPLPPDLSPEVVSTIQRVRPYTMTSAERIAAFVDAVAHVERHRIPGAIVECGVWRGGSVMAAALTLQRMGGVRDLYLFDTFEGMPPPGELDRNFRGTSAVDMLRIDASPDGKTVALAPLDDVRANLASTGYPADRVHFVQGLVEDTIPDAAPAQIAVLRLDTDWYASTRHELEHLVPRLAPNGVLVIDDYGHWEGARRAVDEFLAASPVPILLARTDYTGRIAVVPAP